MKKRILALLLALSMMLSLLPVSAFADTGLIGGITYNALLVMDNNTGKPVTDGREPYGTNGCKGDGWVYDNAGGDVLILESGSYNFNYINPGTSNGGTLDEVKCNIIVQADAEITGGSFTCTAISNYGKIENALLATSSDGQIVNEDGGSITDSIFLFLPHGVTSHSLTAVGGDDITVTLNGSVSHTQNQIFFAGTPTFKVKLSSNGTTKGITTINGKTNYVGLTGPDEGYYTFTPEKEEDIALNREPYVTDLVITADGIPYTEGREPIHDSANKIIGYKGDSWTYMLNGGANGKGTLTLTKRSNSGFYDFSNTNAIECDIIVDATAASSNVEVNSGIFHGAVTLKGGPENCYAVASMCIFSGTVTLEGSQTMLTWSYFGKDAHLVGSSSGYILNCIFAGDTSNYTFSTNTGSCLFASKPANLTTYEVYTEDHKEFSATLYENDEYGYAKCPKVFTDQKKMYVQRVAHLVVTRTDGLAIIDEAALNETGWSGWYRLYPYSNNIILKRNYHLTVENGTLSDTTDAKGDFGSGTSVTVQANAPTDADTHFTGWAVTPADTKLLNGTADVDLTQSTITFGMPIAPGGLTLTATYAPYVTDLVINNITGKPVMEGREPYGTNGCKGNGWKYDGTTLTLESGTYDFTNTKPITKDGETLEVVGSDITVNKGVTITGGTFFSPVVSNSGTIQNSFFAAYSFQNNGGIVTNSVFLTKPTGVECHTLSAVNDNFITLTPNYLSTSTNTTFYFTGTPKFAAKLAHVDDTSIHHINGKKNYGNLTGPDAHGYYTFSVEKEEDILLNDSVSRDPIPTYTLTVTGGGLVNGKPSAVVEAGKEVRLTVGEMQEGMSFNYWDLPTALTQALTDKDSGFSNKVEPLTFIMPDLSKYTEDTSFTIRLDIRPAELPDDDDGPSVLGTMATVAVGGAAAGILVWQGVNLGVDSYLQLSLPDGVPVPANRRELVKLLWETAGKPDVVLPALYGDVSTEDAELQKATRWAIDNGLVKPADETNASRFDPDRSVSKFEVARAWFKVKQMLK